MALSCAASEGVKRTSGVVSAASDYSCTFWFRPHPPAGNGRVPWLLVNGIGTYTEWIAIYGTSGAPNNLFLDIGIAGVSVGSTAVTAIQQDGYVACGYTRSGTTHTFIVNGAVIGTLVQSVAALSFTELRLGDDAGLAAASTIQYFREWSSALTLAQVIAELNSPVPIVTAGLVTDTPLDGDYLDDSGNGNTWVPVGAPGFQSGPVPKPLTNLAGADAYTIALDSEYVQVVRDSGGITRDTWWTYTHTGTSPIMSWWVFGQISVYNVLTNIYADADGITVYKDYFNYAQKPTVVPVTAGVPIWFRAVPNSGNPRAALWIRTRSWVQGDAPAGSLLINDAGPHLPAALLSNMTAYPLRYVPLPGGEHMAQLDDGTLLVEDVVNLKFVLFTSALVDTGVVIPYGGFGWISSDRATRFYTESATDTITAYSTGGVVLGTWTGLTSIARFAPARNNAILYWATGASAAAVQRWDLGLNSPLSNLAAGIASNVVQEIFVLADETILVLYRNGTAAEARRYSTAGTLLNTYTFTGNTGTDPHIALDPADDTVFWGWWKIAGALSRFVQFRVADGTALITLEETHFTNGSMDGAATPTPADFFGHSESCTFIILTGPPPPPPGTGCPNTLAIPVGSLGACASPLSPSTV